MIRKKAVPFEEMETKPLPTTKLNFYLIFSILLWGLHCIYCAQTFEFAYTHQQLIDCCILSLSVNYLYRLPKLIPGYWHQDTTQLIKKPPKILLSLVCYRILMAFFAVFCFCRLIECFFSHIFVLYYAFNPSY